MILRFNRSHRFKAHVRSLPEVMPSLAFGEAEIASELDYGMPFFDALGSATCATTFEATDTLTQILPRFKRKVLLDDIVRPIYMKMK